MDYLTQPKKPSIVSQLSANTQVNRWTELNAIDSITDGDGQKWKAHITVEEKLAATENIRLTWSATVEIKTELDCANLVATGILNEKQDERLIGLLGSQKIPLILKPLVFQATSGEEGKRTVSLRLIQYRENFATQKLFDFKRKYVGKWLDEQRRFDREFSYPET